MTQNHLSDLTPVLSPSTHSPEERPTTLLPEGPEVKAAAAKAEAALSSLLDQLRLHPTPPVRTAVALTALDTALALPPDTLRQEGSAPQEEMQAWARWQNRLGPGVGLCPPCILCDSHVVCRPESMCPSGLPTTVYTRPWPRTRPSLHLGRSCTSWTGSWMGRWGHLGGAGAACGAGGRAQDLPTTGGQSRGGMGGAEPHGR